jgi:hypothetical protein
MYYTFDFSLSLFSFFFFISIHTLNGPRYYYYDVTYLIYALQWTRSLMMKQPMREKDSQTIDKENETRERANARERERRKENIVHYLNHTFVDNVFFKNQPFQ